MRGTRTGRCQVRDDEGWGRGRQGHPAGSKTFIASSAAPLASMQCSLPAINGRVFTSPPCSAGLSGLTRLRLARRPYLTDAQLAPLLEANRGSLRQLELAGCASLTDAVLLHLLPPGHHVGGGSQGKAQAGEQPQTDGRAHEGQDLQQGSDSTGQQQQQQEVVDEKPPQTPAASAQPTRQRQQAPPLERLHLVCCDRIGGGSLRHLRRLRALRLSGCPAIPEAALQAACIYCTRLVLLELPAHIPASRMPVAPAGAASHLHGLQLLGGLQEGGRWGTRGRRRDGGGAS